MMIKFIKHIYFVFKTYSNHKFLFSKFKDILVISHYLFIRITRKSEAPNTP